MPSRRSGSDLVLFSSDDPKPLVSWLVETFGLQTVLGLLSNHVPGEVRASTKRASKKGGKRGRPKGSKNAAKKSSKKSGKKGRKATSGGGASEVGNGK
jgi:hypothetical protein